MQNKRKIAFIFIIVAAISSIFFAFQNFTSFKSEGLSAKESSSTDSLAAALQSAEQDHQAKQMALNVEPVQIQKANAKERKPQTIELPSEIINEVDPLVDGEEYKVPKEEKLIIN